MIFQRIIFNIVFIKLKYEYIKNNDVEKINLLKFY
jgi:hypothetical protein